MTAGQAMKIAQEYKDKYNLGGVIHDDIESSVVYYPSFYRVEGSVWLVKVDIRPKIFEGDDEISIVVSDRDGVVDHVIDYNGISHKFHFPMKREFTDEEYEYLMSDDDDDE